ncbi:MAG: RNA-binding protein [Acidobacteria bacterium]|nr:RNA-binding protein [Acidobacteriota bacterium]
MTNIFVGNLSYQTTESELEAAFSAYGAVERVSVVRDRETGQPRGFAFVEMTNANEAEAAINALNGREMKGRSLNVNQARPREERGGGGGGRGGFNRGGGGRDRQRW